MWKRCSEKWCRNDGTFNENRSQKTSQIQQNMPKRHPKINAKIWYQKVDTRYYHGGEVRGGRGWVGALNINNTKPTINILTSTVVLWKRMIKGLHEEKYKGKHKTNRNRANLRPENEFWKPLDPNGTIIIMFWWKAGSLPGHNGRGSLVQKFDFSNEDNSPKAPFWKSQRSKMPPKSNFPVQIGAGTLSKQSLGAISKEHETSMTLWLEAECF